MDKIKEDMIRAEDRGYEYEGRNLLREMPKPHYFCVFCSKYVEGKGNNPAPIFVMGECCNVCYSTIVAIEKLKGDEK